MAKILKVKLLATQIGVGGLGYTYPSEYDSSKISITVQESCASKVKRDEVLARAVEVGGKQVSEEYLIGVVSDADAAAFLVSPDIEELTEANANLLGNVWFPQITKVRDSKVTLSVLEKLRTGGSPTVYELKAVDPNDATPGVNLGRSHSDRLTNAITERGV